MKLEHVAVNGGPSDITIALIGEQDEKRRSEASMKRRSGSTFPTSRVSLSAVLRER